MQMLPVEEKIYQLVEPILGELGYRVVRVQYQKNPQPTLQIMIEHQDYDNKGEVNVDDCALVSRQVSLLLDVEDPIAEAYHLEVSSPGLDRPLVRREDFERFKGYLIKMQTQPIEVDYNLRKNFKGVLQGINTNGEITLDVESEEPVVVSYDAVKSAQLIITDELLSKHSSQEQ